MGMEFLHMRYNLTVSTKSGGDNYVFRDCGFIKVLFELLKVSLGNGRTLVVEPLLGEQVTIKRRP